MNANRSNKLEFPRAGGLTLTVKRNGPKDVLAYLGFGSHPTRFLCFACADHRTTPQPYLLHDFPESFAFWIGSTSFDLSADESSQVAELLEIQMPAARAAA